MATLIEMVNLAERNKWDFSNSDRPYFMKDGNYAIPDETTSQEDKELLADIISEGSEELAKAMLISWDNGLIPAGPCSGIREYHNEVPRALHFGVKGPSDIILPLSEKLTNDLPEYHHLCREAGDMLRYDLDYFLNGKELTKEESNAIFKKVVESLNETLGIQNENKTLN